MTEITSPTGGKPSLVAVILGLEGGGAENVFARLVAALRSEWDIRVVVFNPGGPYERFLQERGIPIRLISQRQNRIRFIVALRKFIKSQAPDVVLSFLIYTNIATSLALRGTRIPLVMAEHTNYRLGLKGSRFRGIKLALMKRAYRQGNAYAVTSISKEVSRMIRDDFSPKAKVVTIANGLDLSLLESLAREPVPPEFQPVFQAQTIAVCGRLVPLKNHDMLLRVLATGGELTKRAHLLILGQGPHQPDLQRLAEELGVSDRVHFCGFRKNPHAFVSKATLFAMTSDYEGYPGALAEAMFTNGCCVSTDCPTGPNEIIRNGENGFLVPVAGEAELADAIERLLSDKDLRERLRKRARQWASTQEFPDITVARYDQLLRDAIRS